MAERGIESVHQSRIVIARNSSCGKVMFSQAFVIPSVHREGCIPACNGVGCIPAYNGAGGVCLGVSSGGVCPGGLPRYLLPQAATEASGAHPTGMHPCLGECI